jgi:8-oxo-dGTP diphosphatase
MSTRTVMVVGAAIIDEEGRCLVARRAAHKSAPLQWELPGGQVEAGESPQAALQREIMEELGLTIEVGPWLGRGEATYDAAHVVLDVYAAQARAGALCLKDHDQALWVHPSAFDGIAWSAADVPVVRAILTALGGVDDMRPLLTPRP